MAGRRCQGCCLSRSLNGQGFLRRGVQYSLFCFIREEPQDARGVGVCFPQGKPPISRRAIVIHANLRFSCCPLPTKRFTKSSIEELRS